MLFPSPPIAFEFLNLPMLGWLAAAAAPWLIHLLTRRRYRDVPWAAMEYLLAALRRQSRRLRVRHWMLLALRTLLVVLVVLAVAEPTLRVARTALGTTAEGHCILVLDASYSMRYQADGQTRFARAKAFAKEMVERAAPGAAFSLISLGSPSRALVEGPTADHALLRAALEAAEPEYDSFDLAAALNVIEHTLETAAARRYPQCDVVFLTDLGRVGWAGPTAPDQRERLAQRIAALGDRVHWTAVDFGQEGAVNVAAMNLGPRGGKPSAAGGENAGGADTEELAATLHRFGRPAAVQPVELLLNDRPLDARTVELPADDEAQVFFATASAPTAAELAPVSDSSAGAEASPEIDKRESNAAASPNLTPAEPMPPPAPAAGERVFEVLAPGDALELDNRRWVSLPVGRASRALCVVPAVSRFSSGGVDASSTDGLGPSVYLPLALSPETGGPAVQVTTISEVELAGRDLSDYDAVFLCDVAQFSPEEVASLQSFLAGGGGVVIFLGPSVRAARYNEMLLARSGDPLLPAQIGDVVASSRGGLAIVDATHPIVEPFGGPSAASLLTTPVMKHFRLQPADDAAVRTIVAMANGDPLIVERCAGNGRVLLVATSADASWSALPLWPSYVPLVQRMFEYAAGGRTELRNRLVGEPLSGPLGVGQRGLPIVERPDGRRAAAAVGPHGAWRFAQTEMPGVYRVLRDGSASLYAVNLRTAESDLTRIAAEELGANYFRGRGLTLLTPGQTQAWSPDATAAVAGLSAWLLAAALVVAVFESILSWHFSRQLR